MIVRELTTILGFKVDKKGIREFAQSIIGFKTGVALVAGGLITAADQAIRYFSDIANSLNNVKDLADATGTSTANLLAMGKAAAQFRINSAEFLSVYANFNQIVQQARAGSGKLFEISKQTGIQLKKNNGDIEETDILFQRIVGYLSTIRNTQDRIRIAGNIFGNEFAARVANLSNDVDRFNELVAQYSAKTSEIDESIEASQQFEIALINLSESWKTFTQTLLVTVAPLLTLVLDTLTAITNAIGIVTGPSKGIRAFGEELNRDLLRDSDYEDLLRLEQSLQNRSIEPAINQSNNFNFNVPEGTTEEQAKFIRNSVMDAVTVAMDESFMQILNNNPVVA